LLFPLLVGGELLVPEFHTGLVVRVGGVRVGQAHGGVEVVTTRIECPLEDRHDEPGIDEVHHMSDPVRLAHFHHGVLIAGIEGDGAKAWIVHPIDELARAGVVVVRDDPLLEEVATLGDEGCGSSHSPGTDGQDPHHRPSSSG